MQQKIKQRKMTRDDALVPPFHDTEWEEIFDQDPYHNPMEDLVLPPSGASSLLSNEEVAF